MSGKTAKIFGWVAILRFWPIVCVNTRTNIWQLAGMVSQPKTIVTSLNKLVLVPSEHGPLRFASISTMLKSSINHPFPTHKCTHAHIVCVYVVGTPIIKIWMTWFFFMTTPSKRTRLFKFYCLTCCHGIKMPRHAKFRVINWPNFVCLSCLETWRWEIHHSFIKIVAHRRVLSSSWSMKLWIFSLG